jgi:hypothetical protein
LLNFDYISLVTHVAQSISFYISTDAAVGKKVDELDVEVARLQELSLEESTKKAYATHRSSYVTYCKQYDFPLIPISSQQAARYVAYLSRRLSPASISKYI